MNRIVAGVAVWLLVAQVGCGPEQTSRPDVDEAFVTAYGNVAIENAVIRQHTMFPYHFVPDSPKLNSLGRRDLGVLAQHFVDNPGRLNVRQGRTPDELYQSRVDTVRQHLRDAGVRVDDVTMGDDLAGGDGLTSTEVVLILSEAYGEETAD